MLLKIKCDNALDIHLSARQGSDVLRFPALSEWMHFPLFRNIIFLKNKFLCIAVFHEKLEPFRGNGTKKVPFLACFKRTQSAAFFPNCTKKKERNTSNPSLPHPHSRKIAVQSTVLSLGAISFPFAMGIGGENCWVCLFAAGRGLGDVEFMRWCQILLYGGGHCFPELVEMATWGNRKKWKGRGIYLFSSSSFGERKCCTEFTRMGELPEIFAKINRNKFSCRCMPECKICIHDFPAVRIFLFFRRFKSSSSGKCRSLNPAACHWAKNLLWDSRDTFQITVFPSPFSPLKLFPNRGSGICFLRSFPPKRRRENEFESETYAKRSQMCVSKFDFLEISSFCASNWTVFAVSAALEKENTSHTHFPEKGRAT